MVRWPHGLPLRLRESSGAWWTASPSAARMTRVMAGGTLHAIPANRGSMTSTLTTREISLGVLFPDDELSRLAVPAFIIGADLRFEMDRLSVDDDATHNRRKGPVLQSDQFYGRFHYFRGTLRSTHSAHETLNALSKNAAFQALLVKYEVSELFETLRKTAARTFEEVARMRNFFAAHTEDIGLGLCVMDPNRTLKVERSEVGLSDDIAANILIESMFIKLKKEDRQPDGTRPKTITRVIEPRTEIPDEAFHALLTKTSVAAEAVFKAVDMATAIYLRERAPAE